MSENRPIDGRRLLAKWIGRDVRTGEEPDDVIACDAVVAVVVERIIGDEEDGVGGSCAVVAVSDRAVSDDDVIRACIEILDHYGIEVPTDDDEPLDD